MGNVANRLNQAALDFFAQDSFKFRPYLTLELGLRYAWNMSPSEAKDRFVTFDPATVSLIPVTEPYAQNNKNFQPRVSLSWDMFHTGNTILRGGYAYQVDQPITGFVTGLTSNPPLALPISVNTTSSFGVLTSSFNGTPTTTSPLIIIPNFRDANVQSLESEYPAANWQGRRRFEKWSLFGRLKGRIWRLIENIPTNS